MTGVGWETGVAAVDIRAGSAGRMDGGGAKRGVETWRSLRVHMQQAGRQARHVLMTKSGWGPKTSTV